MAKRAAKGEAGINAQLLETAINQINQLWEKCEGKFMDALDDNDKKRVRVVFGVTLDLHENAPVVDTEISFRDKCKEGGMNVIKTFRLGVSEQLDDPTQPALPGADVKGGKLKDDDKEKKKGRGKAADEEPENKEAA